MLKTSYLKQQTNDISQYIKKSISPHYTHNMKALREGKPMHSADLYSEPIWTVLNQTTVQEKLLDLPKSRKSN